MDPKQEPEKARQEWEKEKKRLGVTPGSGWQETDIFKEWENGPPENYVPKLTDAFSRRGGPKIDVKEDYWHLKGLDERTLCGIDTLTALMRDEGGQWREGSLSENAAKLCPACMKVQEEQHSDEEAQGSEGVPGF